MPPIQTLAEFLVTTMLFACLPGPAMLYVAARTVASGRRSGLIAVVGVHVGCYAHIVAAAAGLTVLFHAVPPLYVAAKLGGAAYLIWLGIGLFRAEPGEDVERTRLAPKSERRAFVESIAVEVLNPKTALFFLALLPQFVDPAAGLPLPAQFVALGLVVNLAFSLADIACVLLAALIVRGLGRSDRMRCLLQRAGGSVLVGLGAHLALQRA